MVLLNLPFITIENTIRYFPLIDIVLCYRGNFVNYNGEFLSVDFSGRGYYDHSHYWYSC